MKNKQSPLAVMDNTFKLGLVMVALLFILGVLATVIIQGNYSINLLGVESNRVGDVTSVKVGLEAVAVLLFILPVASAGLTYFQTRNR